MVNTIGDKISLIRIKLGITQQELADKTGTSRPSIVKIENSQKAVSLDEGKAISNAFGISLETLLEEGKEEAVSYTFVKVFKAKGMNQKNIAEIAKYELLFDAFITQE